MKVTVLVCTRNRPERIESCISSILDNTYHDFELLIIDQSTNKKTEEIVKKHISVDKRIKYLYMEGQGKSRALNLGIRNISGDIIATTDDDCTVAKDWIENIIKAFEKNPDVAIVYGRVINKELMEIKDEKFVGHLSKLSFVGDGANRSIRRSVFKKLKGFDELVGPGTPFLAFEDQDFAYRALYYGYKILNAKEVIVTHRPLTKRTAPERISSKRSQAIGAGALCLKSIRCFKLTPLLLCLISYIKDTYGMSKSIMFNKWSIPPNKSRILLILRAWILITYWNLLGMIKSMKYRVDKTRGLFIPKE